MIPVPPLGVQREIVRILDNFTELTARKQQYEYYAEKLLSFDDTYDYLPLSDVAVFRNGIPMMVAESTSVYGENK